MIEAAAVAAVGGLGATVVHLLRRARLVVLVHGFPVARLTVRQALTVARVYGPSWFRSTEVAGIPVPVRVKVSARG